MKACKSAPTRQNPKKISGKISVSCFYGNLVLVVSLQEGIHFFTPRQNTLVHYHCVFDSDNGILRMSTI